MEVGSAVPKRIWSARRGVGEVSSGLGSASGRGDRIGDAGRNSQSLQLTRPEIPPDSHPVVRQQARQSASVASERKKPAPMIHRRAPPPLSGLTEQQTGKGLEQAEDDDKDGCAVLGNGTLARLDVDVRGDARLLSGLLVRELGGLLLAAEGRVARVRLRRDDGRPC